LLATHDAEDVWDLCERVGVLHQGRMVDVDRTAVLRDRAVGDRYLAWVRADDATSSAERAQRAGARVLRSAAAVESGWHEVALEVRGSAGDAARVLAALTSSGAAVARFERVAPSLADLIERVLPAGAARSRGDGDHA
jgi:ABC-type multidrug transport system ATPase subunit